jgi:hypothetical protein
VSALGIILPLVLIFDTFLFSSVAWAQSPQIEVNERGVIRSLRWGDGPPLTAVFLMVPKPGWTGQWFSQESWQPTVFERSEDGTRWNIAGRVQWENGGLECEETIEVHENTLRVVYRCRALGDTQTEHARLILRAPVEEYAGRGSFIATSAGLAWLRPLPEQLPANYHLWSGPAPEWFGWRVGEPIVVCRPEGTWLSSVALQDDRQFNMPYFEVQLPVKDTAQLKDTQEFTCQLVFESTMLSAVKQQGVRIVEAANRWEVAKVSDISSQGELGIAGVEWSAREGPRWRPVELRFEVSGTWENPFDPDQIDVVAVIRRSNGREFVQPAFFSQDYDALTPGGEVLMPSGDPFWCVRWTPQEEGEYSVTLVAKNQGKEASVAAGSYRCVGSEGKGFIRRSPDTPYYLRFDDGSPYFAVGENICWDGDPLLTAYERWFSRLSEAGGNYCRIWLVRWNMGLEWSNEDPARRGYYYGLGKYSLDNAWRLDKVMELAAKHGIYVMLCLGYHGELMDKEDYFKANCWHYNPYNTALGGPCATPADFWSNAEARELYRRRLRYYLARWGAYPNVLSWEFWNEVYAPAEWVREMAAYLGEHDIHSHLRTTTYGRDDTWLLDEMDYSQAHHYGSDEHLRDSAPAIAHTSWDFTEKYKKPFMMGEFGIDWKRSDANHDPRGHGTNMHNGMWAAVASRSFGTAAIWYWDNYVDTLNMYQRFASVARFVKEIDWTRFCPQRAQVQPIRYSSPPERLFTDMTLVLDAKWARQPDAQIVINHDGTASPEAPTAFLFSPGKAELCSPMRLRLDMPQDGTVTITVGRVSASAVIVIKIDGQEAARREYKCGPPGEGPYKQTDYFEQWKIWQSTFDDDITVPIPSGTHQLELSVETGDWLTIPKIIISNYQDATLAPIDAYILTDGKLAVGWIHDQESNWQSDRDGIEPKEWAALRLMFAGLQDGTYEVAWYDTWKGDFVGAEEVRVIDGQANLSVPVFKRDIALIMRPR